MTGFHKQTLRSLLKALPGRPAAGMELPDLPVTGVHYDSRQIQSGFLFVPLRGQTSDGHFYIPQAVQRGAIAVIGEEPAPEIPVPYIRVDNTREALAHLSAALYSFPAHELTVIGVTGTDGKTTTSNILFQILLAAGMRAGIVSTVNAVIGDEVVDTGFHVTTPEAPDVQRYLARMRAAGLTHVILESTSHGLAQHRVTACEFDIAVVTNITHEHLDYHGTYEAYRAAKGRLVSMLQDTPAKPRGNARLAVLNLDDSSYEYLRGLHPPREAAYSLGGRGDVRADNIQYHAGGTDFSVVGPGFNFPVSTRLVGAYNVSNCLAAISAAMIGLGVGPEAVQAGMEAMRGVPGRTEIINMGQNFIAMVDFAHTPNALRQVLALARQMTQGRVIAVFGSAGLRDREKRRLMAEASAELADLSILTAEDPRTESLDDILAEMAAGASAKGGREGESFIRIRDRGDALREAVRRAQPGDLVIACGKGHEQSMCFGETEYDWDDRTAMRAALASLLKVSGPLMPYLPTRDEKRGG